MSDVLSRYDIEKYLTIFNNDIDFQEIVINNYLKSIWISLGIYSNEDSKEEIERKQQAELRALVEFLLQTENRRIVAEESIDDLANQEPIFRGRMADVLEVDFIPSKIFRQIIYTFKYSTIKSFFKENWKSFVPDFDVMHIESAEQISLLQKAFMKEFDRLSETIDEIYNVVDVDRVPNEYLNYLAQLIGYEREDESFLYDASFRELIKNIIEIYKIKGTNYSFELFFNFLGFEVKVNEFWFDRRYSDPNFSINPYTSVSDRNNFGFYLTTIKPTDYVPEGMSSPTSVSEREIVETLDGNEFNRLIASGSFVIDQLLGIEAGYTETPFTYFKTNIMEFTLERIVGGAAGASEGEETGGLTSEETQIIRLYANFLTPIFISRNIVVITAPFETDIESLILKDNNRIDPRAVEAQNPMSVYSNETFFHMYSGLQPTYYYWNDGQRLYADSYTIKDWTGRQHTLNDLVIYSGRMYFCIETHDATGDTSLFDQREKWVKKQERKGGHFLGGFYLDTFYKIYDTNNANSVYSSIKIANPDWEQEQIYTEISRLLSGDTFSITGDIAAESNVITNLSNEDIAELKVGYKVNLKNGLTLGQRNAKITEISGNTVTLDKHSIIAFTTETFEVTYDLFDEYSMYPSRDMIFPFIEKEKGFASPDQQVNSSSFYGQGTPVTFGYNYYTNIKTFRVKAKVEAGSNVILVNPTNEDWEIINYPEVLREISNFIVQRELILLPIDGVFDDKTYNTEDEIISKDPIIISSINTDDYTITLSANAESSVEELSISFAGIDTLANKSFENSSSKFSYYEDPETFPDLYNRAWIKEITKNSINDKTEIKVYDPKRRFIDFKEYENVRPLEFFGKFTNNSNEIKIEDVKPSLRSLNCNYNEVTDELEYCQYIVVRNSNEIDYHYFWFNVENEGIDPAVTIPGVSAANIHSVEVVVNDDNMPLVNLVEIIRNTAIPIVGITFQVFGESLRVDTGNLMEEYSALWKNIEIINKEIILKNDYEKFDLGSLFAGYKMLAIDGVIPETEIISVNRQSRIVKIKDRALSTATRQFNAIKRRFENRIVGTFNSLTNEITNIEFSREVAPNFITNDVNQVYKYGDLTRDINQGATAVGGDNDIVYMCIVEHNTLGDTVLDKNNFKVVQGIDYLRTGMKLKLPNELFEYEIISKSTTEKKITLDKEYGNINEIEKSFSAFEDYYNFIEIKTENPFNDGVYNVEYVNNEMTPIAETNRFMNITTVGITGDVKEEQTSPGGFMWLYKPKRKIGDRIPFLYNTLEMYRRQTAASMQTPVDEFYLLKHGDVDENYPFLFKVEGNFTLGSNVVTITSNNFNRIIIEWQRLESLKVPLKPQVIPFADITAIDEESSTITLSENALNSLNSFEFFIQGYDTAGIKPKGIEYNVTKPNDYATADTNYADWPKGGKLEEVYHNGYPYTTMLEAIDLMKSDERLEEIDKTKNIINYISGVYNDTYERIFNPNNPYSVYSQINDVYISLYSPDFWWGQREVLIQISNLLSNGKLLNGRDESIWDDKERLLNVYNNLSYTEIFGNSGFLNADNRPIYERDLFSPMIVKDFLNYRTEWKSDLFLDFNEFKRLNLEIIENFFTDEFHLAEDYSKKIDVTEKELDEQYIRKDTFYAKAMQDLDAGGMFYKDFDKIIDTTEIDENTEIVGDTAVKRNSFNFLGDATQREFYKEYLDIGFFRLIRKIFRYFYKDLFYMYQDIDYETIFRYFGEMYTLQDESKIKLLTMYYAEELNLFAKDYLNEVKAKEEIKSVYTRKDTFYAKAMQDLDAGGMFYKDIDKILDTTEIDENVEIVGDTAVKRNSFNFLGDATKTEFYKEYLDIGFFRLIRKMFSYFYKDLFYTYEDTRVENILDYFNIMKEMGDLEKTELAYSYLLDELRKLQGRFSNSPSAEETDNSYDENLTTYYTKAESQIPMQKMYFTTSIKNEIRSAFNFYSVTDDKKLFLEYIDIKVESSV